MAITWNNANFSLWDFHYVQIRLSVNLVQKYFQFWVFETHSQYYDLSLSTDAPQIQQEDSSTFSVNSNPGIIVTRDEDNLNLAPKVYLSTKATHNVSVLILVRGYAAEVPVPGLINRNGWVQIRKLYRKIF